MNKVTDPKILQQLNGGPTKVTDPKLLAQLNGTEEDRGPSMLDAAGQMTKDIGAKALGVLEPGIREVAGAVAAIPQGYGEIASAVTGNPKYRDTVREYTTIPKVTDLGEKLTEAYNWMHEKIGAPLIDFIAETDKPEYLKGSNPKANLEREALNRTIAETAVPLATRSLPFIGAGKLGNSFAANEAAKRAGMDITEGRVGPPAPPEPRLPTNPELAPDVQRIIQAEATRNAAPPPVETAAGDAMRVLQAEQARRGVAVPQQLNAGRLDRPITPAPVPPELSVEGQVASQMRDSQAVQATARPQGLAIDHRPTAVPVTEPSPPTPSPLMSLEPRNTVSPDALRQAKLAEMETLKAEAAAALRRGDQPGYEAAVAEMQKRNGVGREPIDSTGMYEPERNNYLPTEKIQDSFGRNQEIPRPDLMEVQKTQRFPDVTRSEFSEFERAKGPVESPVQDPMRRAMLGEEGPKAPERAITHESLLKSMDAELEAARKAGDVEHTKAIEALRNEYDAQRITEEGYRSPLGGPGKKEGGAIDLNLTKEQKDKLWQLGEMQRGLPERAMLQVQMAHGGGVLNPVVEHTGDLIHRMTHHAAYNTVYPEIIYDKVTKVLRYLDSKYGFEKEHAENLRNNASARGISVEQQTKQVSDALAQYAEEHQKLPVYNDIHMMAKQAAVAVGQQRWNDARFWLYKLKDELTSFDFTKGEEIHKFDEFTRKATQFTRSPLGGPGKKEGGAINFWSKKDRGPEFEQFKESLPPFLKGKAGKMWDDLNKVKKPEPGINQNASKALGDIPGVRNMVEEWGDTLKKPEEFVKELDAFPPEPPHLIRDMASRGYNWVLNNDPKMYAMSRKSPLTNYVVTAINKATNKGNRLKTELVSDKVTGIKPKLEALAKADPKAFEAQVMDMLSREGKAYYPASIGPLGPLVRQFTDTLHKMLNDTLVANGSKPIHFREGWWPGGNNAEFVFNAYDKHGNVMISTGGKSAIGARAAMEKAKAWVAKEGIKEYQDLTWGDIEHRVGAGAPGHAFNLAMIEDLFGKNSPELELATSAMERLKMQETYQSGSTKYHFMAKREKPVIGGPGQKPWLDSHTNAQEAVQHLINVGEGMIDWAAAYEVAPNVAKILKDPNILSKFPAQHEYASLLWDTTMGRGNGLMGAYDWAMNTLTSPKGPFGQFLGRNSAAEMLRPINSMFTTTVLMKGGYFGTQFMQPHSTWPQWSAYLHTLGVEHNAVKAAIGALQDATHMNRSALGKDAMAWAHEAKRLDSHLMDNYVDITGRGPLSAANSLAKKSGAAVTMADQYTRGMFYLHVVHALNEAGYPMGPKSFEIAMNMADSAMGNYRTWSRTIALQSLRELGTSVGKFTTYSTNQLNQLSHFGHKAKGALATAMAMNLMLSGFQGLYGSEELDAGIEGWNTLAANAGWSSIPRLKTVPELFMEADSQGRLRTKNKIMSYGALSALTDIDLTKSLGTGNPIPDDAASALSRSASYYGKIIKDLAEYAIHPNDTDKMKAIHSVTPPGLRWLPEMANSYKTTNEKGETVYRYYSPQTNKYEFARTQGDWAKRMMALYGLEEADSRLAQNVYRKRKEYLDTMAKSLYDQGKKTGNMEEYAKFTGSVPYQQMIKDEQSRHMDPDTRVLGIPNNMRQFKRRQDMVGGGQ